MSTTSFLGRKPVRPVVIGPSCTACGSCLLTCPCGALLPAPLRPVVVETACTGCLECVEVCPVDAISEAGALSSGEAGDGAEPHR